MIGRPIKFLTAALCASTVILTGCAADRLHHEGMKSVEHGNYEDGVARLQKAVEKEPDNLTFRLDLRARSEEAVQKLIAEADAARAAGKREEAAAAYRRVLAINPANDRALRGVEGVDADRRHTDAVAAAQKDVAAKDLDHAETMLRAVLAEDPGFGPAVSLHARMDGEITATPGGPPIALLLGAADEFENEADVGDAFASLQLEPADGQELVREDADAAMHSLAEALKARLGAEIRS